jgi:hypothetical protein
MTMLTPLPTKRTLTEEEKRTFHSELATYTEQEIAIAIDTYNMAFTDGYDAGNPDFIRKPIKKSKGV